MPGPVSDAEAEAIVRDLAQVDPMHNYSVQSDWCAWECLFCKGNDGTRENNRSDITLEQHSPSCPWRRAREWVNNHPDPVDPT